MAFIGINIQGNIISSEIIEKIREEDQKLFQKPADFGLPRNVTVRDEINTVWSSVKSYWEAFRIRRDRIKEGDSGITETRQGWMMPFFLEMGYDLDYQRKAEIINDKLYPISHKTLNRGDFPVYIAGINQSLDKRSDSGGMRLSPHALVQEYVNNHEHLYAIVTNGRSLRLLRDATRLSRLSFLEFDLERIMEDNLFNEFALLYRLLHVTRMPESQEKGEDAIIELFHQESLASGSRIRKKLSEAVEQAITQLANGYLLHRDNERLRNTVLSNDLTSSNLYLYLLRIVYRMLFLMVIEERNLIFPDKRDPATERFRNLYYRHFSLKRLRGLSLVSLYVDSAQSDLWEGLKSTFRLFEEETIGNKMGIKSLGSGLFDPDALGDLAKVKLDNATFLKVLKILTTFKNENGQMVTVNYGDLDVEEFGSVYEGLLEYDAETTIINHKTIFSFKPGTGRSSSGAHYTPEELVKPLIKHSLDYLIEDCIIKPEVRLQVSSPESGEVSRMKRDGGVNKKLLQERALLSLKVADVACGSGHILLSAARRIALELARLRTGEDQPSPLSNRMALRDVIKNCIYGVDKNPLAVELCKVALWLESHSPGEPLGFLDHHIKCGDSIVGLALQEELEKGIPDEAFKTLPGDDKEVAAFFLKKNKAERRLREREDSGVQLNMTAIMENTVQEAMAEYRTLNQLPERTPEEIRVKEKSYRKFLDSKGYSWLKAMADTQVAQFFIPKTQANKPYLITDADYRTMLRGYAGWQNQQTAKAVAVAQEKRFFHWFLEFPEVFQRGGFDCVLGNPPYLGGKKISGSYGDDYNCFLKDYYPGTIGSIDLVVYFLRRISKIKISFLSLITTQSIHEGISRIAGLQYLLTNENLKINFAVKDTIWPGKAATIVDIFSVCDKGINIINYNRLGRCDALNSFLEPEIETKNPYKLKFNNNNCFQGCVISGNGFIIDFNEYKSINFNSEIVVPYLIGDDLINNINQENSRWIINFKDYPLSQAQKYPKELSILSERVKPERDKVKRDSYREKWWQFAEKAVSLYLTIKNRKGFFVVAKTSKHLVFVFKNNINWVYDQSLTVITLQEKFYFSILQSSLHNEWGRKYSTSQGGTPRYNPTDSFQNFPLPQKLQHKHESKLESLGKIYYEYRQQLMIEIQLGLTKTYNAFHAPEIQPGITSVALQGKDKKAIEKNYGKEVWNLWNHLQKTAETCSIEEAIAGIVRLRELHVEMDNAVLEAYGWAPAKISSPDSGEVSRSSADGSGGGGIELKHDFYEVDYLPENDRIRFTIHPDARREVLKRLLELNHKIHEEEVRAGLWNKNKTKDKKLKDKSISTDDSEDEELNYKEEGEEEQLLEAAEESMSLAFEPGTLFHSAPVQGLMATGNCRVVIRNKQGLTFKYHITPKAEKDHYSGDYRQIKPTSPLAEQIIGKSEGKEFEYGGIQFTIETIDIKLVS